MQSAHLYWNVRPSLLVEANKGMLKEEFRYIGSSVSAVNAMLQRDSMMKELMPSLISLSPTSPDWDERIRNYFASTHYPVPPQGETFDLSLTFDIHDFRYKENIQNLSKISGVKFETTEDLTAYLYKTVNGTPTVPFDLLWKYGKPNNLLHYILYIYTWKLSTVANHFSDVEKSSKIKFYWNTAEDIAKANAEISNNISKAIHNLSKIIGDDNMVERVLHMVLTPMDLALLTTPQSRIQRLKQFSDSDPARFNKIMADKNLELKSTIEKMVHAGILKRLEGSTMIVDPTDPTVVIGKNMDEVIIFMKDEVNKQQVLQYNLKLKNLSK